MPRSHKRSIPRIRARIVQAARWIRSVVRDWRHRVRVEVLVVDPHRRRTLERELTSALRQLERVVGRAILADSVVVVQQVLRTDRSLAGCCQISRHPDGRRSVLIRLALQVNGRPVSPDELMAALAEQCIGVFVQEDPGQTIVIPVELDPYHAEHDGRLVALPADPLLSRANGASEHAA